MSTVLSCIRVPAFVFLLLAGALTPGLALAGQNITINGQVGHTVYGNGDATNNGNAPISNDPISLVNSPDGNTVTINSGATVNGAVEGGMIENPTGPATVTGSHVFSSGTVVDYIDGGYAISESGPATATENSVTVTDGTVSGVWGGDTWSESGPATATGNSATVSGGTVGGVTGGSAGSDSGDATAEGNSATVSDSTVGGIAGGSASSDSGTVTATGNSATVSGGTVDGVAGGEAWSNSGAATATGNTVEVSDSTVRGVTGGYADSDSGNATTMRNSATISDGGVADGDVWGGDALSNSVTATATATGNNATISGDGHVKGSVWGGRAGNVSGTATTTDNTVEVRGDGVVDGNVWGGEARSVSGNATTTDNTVIIREGSLGGVYGGFASSDSGSATVTDNHVTVNSGSVDGGVWGGNAFSFSNAATASENTVDVSSGTVGVVYGGDAYSNSGTATASDNIVIIRGGSLGGVSGGYAYSNSGSVTATGNTVEVSGGSVFGINGGEVHSGSNIATATKNTVKVSGGVVKDNVWGGYADSNSKAATAFNNDAIIEGGDVGNFVVGGGAYSYSGTATATGNRVTISGGTIRGNVYGGYSVLAGTAIGSATDNSVTISGAPDFTASSLYGGFVGSGIASDANPVAGMDAFSGNTLNVWSYNGSTVRSVQNFEQYNFIFPVSQIGPVLTVTDRAVLGDGTRSSIVTAGTLGGSSPLQVGDSVTLISGDIDCNGFSQTNAEGLHGTTLRYNWTLDASSGTALTATVNSVKGDSAEINPRSKALSEGWLGGMALVNQGADIAAGAGMANAVQAAHSAGNSFAGFGSASGGWSRYNTGSHVDVSSISLLTGISYGMDLTPGRLTLGAFFEYGNGSYDTHNSFSNAASVKGDGDMYYIGGGILGRMDFAKTGPGRFYTEASGRAGKIHNEYDSSDLRDIADRKAKYDSSSAYYGMHLGAGYIWNMTEAASFDLYGKYLWTRQEGDTVTLSTKDRVKFKDSDSHRLRLGSRFTYAVCEYASPYVGAAWEHEFDGKAKATSYGYSIDAPSLKGDTGVGELGLTLRPIKDSGFSMDLGVQGYIGLREGVTGSFQLKYAF